MKELDALIAKYEAGETSLQEEKKLAELLISQSDSAYVYYKSIFGAYNTMQSLAITNTEFDKQFVSKLRYSGKRIFHNWTFRLATLSIAATVIITVAFITISADKEAYVVEQGVRYDDMEKAVGYADEAINEAIAPLQQSMQSLAPISGLEGSLHATFPIQNGDNNYLIEDDTMYRSRN